MPCQFHQFLRKVELHREFHYPCPSTVRFDSNSSSKYHGSPHDLMVARQGMCASMLGVACICAQEKTQLDPCLIKSHIDPTDLEARGSLNQSLGCCLQGRRGCQIQWSRYDVNDDARPKCFDRFTNGYSSNYYNCTRQSLHYSSL